ncbi:hypothetical protein Tco_0480036, partial [Tanacetum coccineum]
GATTGERGNSNNGSRVSCDDDTGLYSAGLDSPSASVSSEHKKGKTNGKSRVGGKESSDGSESKEGK